MTYPNLFVISNCSETVFQTNSGYEQKSVRVSMETLTPGLWLDHNVIDSWSALLNLEERATLLKLVEAGKVNERLRRLFFTTGCIVSFYSHVAMFFFIL